MTSTSRFSIKVLAFSKNCGTDLRNKTFFAEKPPRAAFFSPYKSSRFPTKMHFLKFWSNKYNMWRPRHAFSLKYSCFQINCESDLQNKTIFAEKRPRAAFFWQKNPRVSQQKCIFSNSGVK